MFLQITNHNQEILYSNIPEACRTCAHGCEKEMDIIVCAGTQSRRRRARSTTKDGTIYFCGDDKALLKSRRIVRERLRVYSEMLAELEQIRKSLAQNVNKHMKRLMHNLISQNAHSIQEIYDIVPQEALGRKMSEQVNSVKDALRTDPTKAAKAFLRMNKHNVAMKCEFSAFRLLYDGSPPSLKTRGHKLRKVVLNALHLFFQDFKEKGVYVDVEAFEGSVAMDYESVQVAMYHLIDNAVKYVLANSRVDVTFPIIDSRQRVRFNMVSTIIEDADMSRLFEEGYSGQLPRALKLAGHGLGLGIARELLKLNRAEIKISRNVDPALRQSVMMGTYENNYFDIVLGKPL